MRFEVRNGMNTNHPRGTRKHTHTHTYMQAHSHTWYLLLVTAINDRTIVANSLGTAINDRTIVFEYLSLYQHILSTHGHHLSPLLTG